MGLLSTLVFTGWAARTASRSAKAAEDAVEALPTIERAYLFPEITNSDAIGAVIIAATGGTFAPGAPPAGIAGAQHTAEVSFKIKNFGKTPAVLKRVSAELGIAPLKSQLVLPIQNPVLGPHEETRSFNRAMERGLTQEEAFRISTLTAQIALVGAVTFDDIWGRHWETRFHYGWDTSTNSFTLHSVWTEEVKG